MPKSAESPTGRVRWKRFAAILAPGALAAGALVFMTAQGAIAASFAVSGSSFKVSVDSLDGKGFEQFGTIDKSANGAHPVAVAAFNSATLHGLCQSVLVPTPIGNVTIVLKAGGSGAGAVEAKNLTLDAESLSANAEFTNIEIGRDASTLDQVPDVTGPAGGFGQQATAAHLDNVKQVAWATTAGSFKLNGLSLNVQPGTHECF